MIRPAGWSFLTLCPQPASVSSAERERVRQMDEAWESKTALESQAPREENVQRERENAAAISRAKEM